MSLRPEYFSRNRDVAWHLEFAFANFLNRRELRLRRKKEPTTLGEIIDLQRKSEREAVRATYIYKRLFRKRIEKDIADQKKNEGSESTSVSESIS